jgi:hypothetical protein
MDMEVREVILVEELEHVLHPPNGQDLLAELDKARACMDWTANDHAVKAE